jgi:hypothetical protein
MKVLDLRCPHDHRFEGWFASEDDFQSQCERGLVDCPVCGAQGIARMPSAPRLNVSGAREPQSEVAAKPAGASPGGEVTLQSAWMKAVRHVLDHTDDVGERFAEEARKIHYGEIDERAIRGRATPEEARALHDEGIEVMSLPMPSGLKGPLQ